MDMGNEHERADAGLRAEEQRAREVLKSENVKHADAPTVVLLNFEALIDNIDAPFECERVYSHAE